ncbi:MAG: phosphoadenosine phosphosulfate reductase family protein [Candidatus Aerophobetes bacterium]|nr:phosphoadenosine phosphosulfate reductase family protein [Candidatus Aerophobetes bacterium]
MNKFHAIEKEIAESAQRWESIAITFSGGKDSTALTFALLNAFEGRGRKPAKVRILYANTLVEPPPLLQTAEKSLDLFENLGEQTGIPIIPQILTPKLKERFWVLLIGKGYPPPSFKFRWCSDRLKIRPVKRFLKQVRKQEGDFPLVLSGVRLKEGDRKKTLSKKLIRDKWMKYEGLRDCLVFAPLLHLETSEVWEYIEYNERKWRMDMQYLRALYSIASDDVNTFRTGCWVCTLIKRDRSLEKLAEKRPALVPLIEFRKFLLEVRDNKKLRKRVNRNGKSYLGPLNMPTRKRILSAVEEIWQLPSEEKEAIYEIWQEL